MQEQFNQTKREFKIQNYSSKTIKTIDFNANRFESK